MARWIAGPFVRANALDCGPWSLSRALSVAEAVLIERGPEPYRTDDKLRVRNCPFHSLCRKAPELICGVNREFIDGLLRDLGNDSVEGVLDPQPGRCWRSPVAARQAVGHPAPHQSSRSRLTRPPLYS